VTPVEVIVYTRPGCHLCDQAKESIERLRTANRLDLAVREVNIDLDPALRELYDHEVPVIFIGGRKAFKYRIDDSQFIDRVRRAR
jgi:glutaredoxin